MTREEFAKYLVENGKCCESCGCLLEQVFAFCMSCGSPNPDFDPVDSEDYTHETLEEAQENLCHLWHMSTRDNPLGSSLEDAIRFPFCPWCGKRILDKGHLN